MLLLSSDRAAFLRLDLIPFPRTEHEGWISYRLLLGALPEPPTRRERCFGSAYRGARATSFELRSSQDEELFLCIDPENEVEKLVAILRSEGPGASVFSPMDEEEFELRLSGHRTTALLSVSPDSRYGYCGPWTDGVKVNASDLQRFADGIVLELQALRDASAQEPG